MQSITIVNEWEKRATDFILGIILHLITVIQIDIISFCLGKRDSEILAAVHSTQLWVLVKYHLFLINVRSFTKSKFKYSYKLITLLYLILTNKKVISTISKFYL